MSAMKKPDNMKLWNKVCTTDPDMTKKVSQRGGFTSIEAQYQIKLATEQWGPYGTEWGVCDLEWRLFGPEDKPVEIALNAEFYYPGGSFVMAVDRPYKVGDEQRKKMLTDFTSKALSKLGFNSDVFEGMFDSHPYVDKLKKEKAKAKAPAKPSKGFCGKDPASIEGTPPNTSTNQDKGTDEADMTQNQLLKKAKGEVMGLAKELWPTMSNKDVGAQIKATGERLQVSLDSFDGVHAVRGEIRNMLNKKKSVINRAKDEASAEDVPGM